MSEIKSKKCTKCGIEKNIDCFGVLRKSKDGRNYACKECNIKNAKRYYKENSESIAIKAKVFRVNNDKKIKEYSKKYRIENKDKKRLADKKYVEKNYEKLRVYKKKYVEENKVILAEKSKIYRTENKDKIRADKKNYRVMNAEKVKESNRKCYEKNKDKYCRRNRAYKKEKMNNDPVFRLKELLRGRVYKAIKQKNVNKNFKTLDLLGCSPSFYLDYLQSQFTDGMTWENHGEWHIDHIKPCASFDLTDSEQQKECFNYLNTQPLWAKDNFSKGFKYE